MGNGFDYKKAPPAEPDKKPSLSDQVKQLESKFESMSDLAGEVIATISVNLKRGSIVVNNECKGSFDITQKVEFWFEIFNQIRSK